jgi:hypothetical protein
MNEAWERTMAAKWKSTAQPAKATIPARCKKCDQPLLSPAQIEAACASADREKRFFLRWCVCSKTYDPSVARKARECVYIIGNLDVGFVKVGYSKGPRQRIPALAHQLPFEIETLAIIRGSMRLERAIHRYLRPHRARGEWFRATIPVREFIILAQSGRLQEMATSWLAALPGRVDLEEMLKKTEGGPLARMRKRG